MLRASSAAERDLAGGLVGAGPAGGDAAPSMGEASRGSATSAAAVVGEAAADPSASATTSGRAPLLLAAGDLCAAYFPAHAEADRGEVQIEVVVDASGRAEPREVLIEAPLNQGFAGAARECARWLRFAPAMSESGAPTVGHAKLKLRFKRRTA